MPPSPRATTLFVEQCVCRHLYSTEVLSNQFDRRSVQSTATGRYKNPFRFHPEANRLLRREWTNGYLFQGLRRKRINTAAFGTGTRGQSFVEFIRDTKEELLHVQYDITGI